MNLGGFLAVFIAITKNWIRSKTGVFFSFLFPVMLLLVFGTIFGEHEVKYTLYVQNLDINDGKETNLSKCFIEALNSTFNVKRVVDVVELANQQPFKVKRALIIPKGFEREALNRSVSVRIGVIADTFTKLMEKYGKYINESAKKNITKGQKMLNFWKNKTSSKAEIILLADENDPSYPVVYGILHSVTSAFNNKLIGAEDVINITTKPITRKLRMVDYYLSGYIAAFIMTNGIIGVTSTVSEYRRNGTLKRLAATPLSKTSWIIANIAQQTLLAILLTVLMVFLGRLVFNTHEVPNIFAWLLILTGAVTFCSIGMVLGGVVKDVEAATGLGNAIAFPMMFLSGAFWPVEIMPEYMQSIARVLPLYYFHQGLRSIMTFNMLDTTSFMVLGTLAAIFIPLAVRVTKWRDFG